MKQFPAKIPEAGNIAKSVTPEGNKLMYCYLNNGLSQALSLETGKNSFDKSSNFRGDFYFDKKVQGTYMQ